MKTIVEVSPVASQAEAYEQRHKFRQGFTHREVSFCEFDVALLLPSGFLLALYVRQQPLQDNTKS